MIRFLQKDSKVVKAFFVVVIAVASVGMVVYLIPGLMAGGSTPADTYAVIYPHWYSRFFASGTVISEQKVAQLARMQVQQRSPQYADNPTIMSFFEQQVGQQLVQQQVLVTEAEKLGIHVTNDDVRQYLQSGPAAQVLFPNGKFVGQEQYAAIIASRFDISVPQFEENVRNDIAVQRLESLITAGVTVSDKEVRDLYRKNNTKIKFDYAVISSDDLRKTINPSDAELEAYFKQNAARYARAVPEQRTITYFAFAANEVPGGVPQPTQQEIQQYYNAHMQQYSVPEQARSRHILISVPAGADAKTDAAAKAKAEMVLKLLKNGGDWKTLAKKYSDDPGSKDSGGELGFAQRGRMVPQFDNAIFTQKIGDIEIVKSQFGYHVVQVEERTPAHTQPLNEVLPTIQATLIRQQSAAAQANYAHELTSEAIKDGLEKTAEAHHLHVATTPPTAEQGVISALPDGSQILAKAFQSKVGDPPQSAQTGEGYAVFQVTGITPAHAPTFADWKSHVLDDYRDEKLPALLSQKTKELADKAASMNDLAKAAKAVGATMKTSDLVGQSDQVPDLGAVGQLAPQLFNMTPGTISGPIDAGRTGVVAKLIDKQVPTPEEIQKNLDQTRDAVLNEKQNQAFEVFASNVINDYKKHNRIRITARANPELPGE